MLISSGFWLTAGLPDNLQARAHTHLLSTATKHSTQHWQVNRWLPHNWSPSSSPGPCWPTAHESLMIYCAIVHGTCGVCGPGPVLVQAVGNDPPQLCLWQPLTSVLHFVIRLPSLRIQVEGQQPVFTHQQPPSSTCNNSSYRTRCTAAAGVIVVAAAQLQVITTVAVAAHKLSRLLPLLLCLLQLWLPRRLLLPRSQLSHLLPCSARRSWQGFA